MTYRINIEDVVIRAVMLMIKRTRGTCLTFTPKKVAKVADLDTKPVTLSVVRHVIDTKILPQGGVAIYRKTSHGVKYIIYSSSPLWQKAKTS